LIPLQKSSVSNEIVAKCKVTLIRVNKPKKNIEIQCNDPEKDLVEGDF
jgi:hypothetical protein